MAVACGRAGAARIGAARATIAIGPADVTAHEVALINVKGLASLLEQASRSVHSICYAHGLHPAQWSALRYFAEASARARTVSGLAHYQGTTLAPASRTLSALVRKGYLVAVVDPNDRRSRTMELTDAGRALLDQDPLNDIAGLLADLPESDRAALAQALESFLDTAAKSGNGAAGASGNGHGDAAPDTAGDAQNTRDYQASPSEAAEQAPDNERPVA